MYHISREKDKPDIGYMEATVDKLMRRGIRLANCRELMEHYVSLRDALAEDFKSKYEIDNPNSAVQITGLLERLCSTVDITSRNDIINICYDDETMKWTSKAEALNKLADLGYEFAQDLTDYRLAKKYAESLVSLIEAADENNLIHPTVTLGKTNRVNYSKPGIMSIPKKLLWSALAPYEPGNVLFSIDIKNQEPSILINLTGAEELRYALTSEEGLYETMFKQCFKPTATANVLVDTLPENRVYSIPELKAIGTISPASYSSVRPLTKGITYKGKRVTGIETVCIGSEKGIYPALPDEVTIELEDGSLVQTKVEWESADKKYKRANDYSLEGNLIELDVEVGKAERSEFKTSYLALTYGASAFGVKQTCKTIDGSRVYKYITGIEAIKNYRGQIDKLAKQGVNVIGTAFGTKVYAGVDGDDSKRLKRVLLDLPIQGTGADILSLLIKRFYTYTEEKALSDVMSLYYTRHDELIVEVRGDWLESVGEDEVKNILTDMLEHQVDNWIPFKVEVNRIEAGVASTKIEDED